jgi:hypothetical protein
LIIEDAPVGFNDVDRNNFEVVEVADLSHRFIMAIGGMASSGNAIFFDQHAKNSTSKKESSLASPS